MGPARRFEFLVAVLAAVSSGALGCDSLRARMVAQDGVNLYRDGQLNEAAAKFLEAAQLAPTIPAIQLNLGFANLAVYQSGPKGDIGPTAAKRAITAFEEYLRLKPNEERAKSYLVQTFVDTGRYEDAEGYFRPLVEKSPPDAEALSTLGTIASKTGKYLEAKKWYARRVEADPKNADAQLALGVLMWDHLHSLPDVKGMPRIAAANEAIRVLCEAVKLKPNGPNGYTYTNLIFRERSLAAANDDDKRVDLELANKFFRLANDLQHPGADVKKLETEGLKLEGEAELAEKASTLKLKEAALAAEQAAMAAAAEEAAGDKKSKKKKGSK
jgi:tetratricopeptide (TPR) repeat protein